MEFINTIWHEHPELLVSCVLLGLFGVLMLVSESARKQFKGGLFLLVTIIVLAVGYNYVTGKSVADIPQQIDTYFNTERAPETTSHRYYSDPLEGAPDSLRGDD
jgi:hypothetical protein